MIRRLLTTMMLCLGLLGAVTATAHAAGGSPPPRCFNRLGPHGEVPSCTFNGTRWVVSYDDGPAGLAGQGAASGIMVLALIGVVAGIGVTVWRLSLARRMAAESGMDPDRATAMTLLSDDGLDATYLASSLRGTSSADQSAQRPSRGAEDRLRELQQLRDDGLITAEEYDVRRTAIIDAI
jgi:hypothetical protein